MCRVSKILFILIKKIYSFTLLRRFLFCNSMDCVMSFTCAFVWCRSILCRCSIPCLLLLSFELSKYATNHSYCFHSYFYRQNGKYRHTSTKSTGNRWIFWIRRQWQHSQPVNQPWENHRWLFEIFKFDSRTGKLCAINANCTCLHILFPQWSKCHILPIVSNKKYRTYFICGCWCFGIQ